MAEYPRSPAGSGYPAKPDPKYGAGYGGGYDENAVPPHQAGHEHEDSGYGSYASKPAGQYDPHNFPPPPRSDSHQGYPEDQAYYQHDNASYASQQRGWQGSQQGGYRGQASQAPSDAYTYEGAALEPYDEEKAYAQYTDAYGPPDYSQYGQQYYQAPPRPPPPTSSIDGYGQGQQDRRRASYQDDRGSRYDDRDLNRDRYREPRRDSRPPISASEDYERRRREHRDRARDDYYYDYRPRERKHMSPTKSSRERGGKDILRGGDGERGLGATLLGGAAGAFLGDQADRGALGTIGGAVLGAVAAGGIDRMKSKKDQEKMLNEKKLRDRRRYEDEYVGNGGQDPYHSARGLTVSPSAAPRDEFRPRRQLHGPPRRRGRHEQSSSDSYTSDD